MENLASTINKPLLTNDVIVELFDGIYNIHDDGINHLHLHNSLTFNGKSDTRFNFQNSEKSSLIFHFSAGSYDKKLIFNNIKFYDFDGSQYENSSLFPGGPEDRTDRYTIEFNNCEFYNIKGIVLNINIICLKRTQSTPNVIFNNCKFENINEVFQSYHQDSLYNSIN
ncbi:hypothetical protein LY90DRAFT_678628, partial [Neocallimastix californiae]